MRFSLHWARRDSYSARATPESLHVLTQDIGQSIEERAIVLHAHGVHRAGMRRLADVFVSVGLELLVLPLQVGHLASGVGHRTAQFLRGILGDFLDRLEPLRSSWVMASPRRRSARRRARRREVRHELMQVRITSLEADRLVHVLAQELQYFRPLLDRQIDARIGPAPVGADRDQVAVLLIDEYTCLNLMARSSCSRVESGAWRG
jgi:hypothetical protein